MKFNAVSLPLLALGSTACNLEIAGVGLYLEYADCPADFEQELVTRINDERRRGRHCGDTYYPPAPDLQWEAALADTAAAHASDMAHYDFLAHTGPDGTSVELRLSSHGYIAVGVGENIAGGYTSVHGTLEAWFASTGHCANLMDPDFVHVAGACAGREDTQYGTYWDLVLSWQ